MPKVHADVHGGYNMGVNLSLKNVKAKGGGKYEFRKPFPPSLQAALGTQLRETATWHNEKALVRWASALYERWEKTVAAQRALTAVSAETPRELWAAGVARATDLVAGVVGVDEDDARGLVADLVLARYPVDSDDGLSVGVTPQDRYIVNALLDPAAAAPEPTLRDAMKEYLKEKIGEIKGRRGRNSAGSVERVFGYAFEALGKRADFPLSELGNADGLKVRDFMIARPRQGGGNVKPASVRREMNPLSAALELAIKNFDLELRAKNIFKRIEIPGLSDEDEADMRDPLPSSVITAITYRLNSQKERKNSALPPLRLIWRLLVGTGCRIGEIAGLRVADVQTDGPMPHLRVRWNEDRRVKTRTSIRSVPLCGDALVAAKEACAAAGRGLPLFPRYGGPTGGNNASAAMMNHINAVSSNPKHVTHSLRHNMADWLRLSEAPDRAAKLILGHSLGGIGDRVYGGKPADLRATRDAMVAAQAFAAAEERAASDEVQLVVSGALKI